jgi:nitrogen fixation/metabolism regulation signal transduction histidine kinase
MTLRTRLVVYLAVVHAMSAGLAGVLLRRQPWALVPIELVLALSIGTGIALIRRLTRSLAVAADAARLIAEGEFTSHFVRSGDAEVDALTSVYNRMADSLRDERTRLQEQHHFFRQVLHVSPSGLVILDFDRRVSDLNPAAARLLGLERDAAVGVSLDALPSPLAPGLAALTPHQSVVVGLAGARRLRCHCGSFIDRGFPRVFFVVDELTEELRQFERAAYEKLIRVMSHEVNNTVTAANSLLESSLTYGRELHGESRTDFERAIAIVIERTAQLSVFMRRFADVFRLPPPVLQRTALVPVVQALVRLVAARDDARGMTWVFEAPDAAVTAAIDRGQFEQACLNVLTNAVEAAGRGGTIHVRIDREHGRACLVIEDNGPGLSAEARENVFTPFFSTKSGGQGIGLTLVQEILTAHRCTFALENRSGGGTRFRIDFP